MLARSIGVRGYAETTYRAGSWDRDRRVVARIEATDQGLDIRYVVTILGIGSAEWSTTASIVHAARPRT
jgi:Transposase DDE domain group 1